MKFFNNLEANDNLFSLSNSVTGSARVLVSSTDLAELYSFSGDEFHGAKFVVQVMTASDNCVREVLGVHNDVDGYLTEYAIVGTSEDLEQDDYRFFVDSSDVVFGVVPTTTEPRDFRVHFVLLRHDY